MENSLPGNIDGYPVAKELGRGASGIVYLVKLPGRQKFAALKLFTGELTDADILRFRREFGALARCRHEGIVSVYGLGEHENSPYILMEYVKGKPIDIALRDGLRLHQPLTMDRIPRCIQVFSRILHILNYLHQKRIVHSDIKPANIFINDNDQVKILDFGLSWNRSAYSSLKPGGTAGYQAPEIILNRPVDLRADLYSLGVTFFEILSGVHPFTGYKDWQDLLGRQLAGKYASIKLLNPEIGDIWIYFLDKLMAPDPSERFYSGAQALVELDRISSGSVSTLSTPNTVQEEMCGILNTPWVGPDDLILSAVNSLNNGKNVCFDAPAGSGRTRFLYEITGKISPNKQVLRINAHFDKPEEWISQLFKYVVYTQEVDSAEKRMIEDFMSGKKKPFSGAEQITEDVFKRALVNVLNRNESDVSLLVVLDDADHGTPASLSILAALQNVHWIQILIVTDTVSEVFQDGCEIISWTPATPDHVKELIKKMLSPARPVSDKVALSLHRLAQGKLGTIVQFFKIWLRSEHLKFQDGRWFLLPPASLQPAFLDSDVSAEWITRRPEIQRVLPENERLEREMLRMISVSYKPVTFQILSKFFAAREPLILETLDKLIRKGWLVESVKNEGIKYKFEQEQDKSSVYETLSPFHKRYLHRRILDIISKMPGADPIELAEHVIHSEAPIDVLPYLEDAVQFAQDHFDTQRALDYLDQMQRIISDSIKSSADILPGPVEWSYRQSNVSNLTVLEGLKNAGVYQSEKLRTKVLEISNIKGNIFGRTGDYGSAFDAYQHMLAGAQDLGNQKLESDALRLIGQILYYQRKLNESEKYFFRSLEIRKNIKDEPGIADCLNALGVIAQQMNQNEKAHQFFLQSLVIRAEQNDERGVAYVRNNLANLYYSDKKYDKALVEFKAAADVSRKLKDNIGLAYCLYNIGGVYIEIGRYHEAIEALEEALSIRRKMQDLQDIGHCLWQQATALYKLEKHQEALERLNEAIDVLEEMGLSDDVTECKALMEEIRLQADKQNK